MMRRTLLLTTALVAGLVLATPARAEPISTAIAVALGGGAVATAVATFAVNTVASMALSALAASLTSKPRPPGMLIEWTARGGANSATFGLGRFATPGQFVCPPMSHGQAGRTPNAYFTQVIALADLPDHALSRVMLGGEYIPIGSTPHADYGLPLLGKYEGRAWIRYHDGTQTTADAMLLDKYADWPDRPWTADMVGTGVCYAVLTFLFDRELYQGAPPDAAFEMFGIPLYDPRKDSTVGGSGAHRWNDPATWEPTQNPIVMIYNILRGIHFPDGSVWGGECEAEDLPLANWAAAMNVCDETVNLSGGGTQPRYRAGLEIRVAEDEPADIVDQLLKAASARIVEIGGVFKVRAGGLGLPVAFITDDDLLVTSPQEFRPFPGLAASHNAIHATFPNPGQMWRAHDAAPVYNAAWELRDGGRRLVAEIDLPAVNYPLQVQRLMRAWIRDDQRWRRHDLNLGFYAAALEPLDCIEWSSKENGYDEKLFEIDQTAQDPVSLQTGIAIREVDPDDYDWSPDFELPDPVSPGGWVLAPTQAVPGWAVTGHTVVDADSNARRPALRVVWDPEAIEDVRLLRVRVRLAGDVGNGWTVAVNDVEAGEAIISEGILPGTAYEARARLVTDRPNDWSSWIGAVAPDIRITDSDIAPGGVGEVSLSAGVKGSIADAQQDAADALEAAGVVQGNLNQAAQTLRQDFEAADVLLSRSIVDLNTARLGDNLIPNGMFLGGDLAQWSNVAPTFSVIERDPGHSVAAIQNAPYAHILSIQQRATVADGIALFEFPVQPGEQFQGSFMYATGGGQRDATLPMRFQFRDVEGAIVPSGSSIVRAVGNVSNIAWAATDFAPVVAPAGAATLTIIIRRNGGGAGDAYLAAIKCDRLDGAAAAAISAEASIREGADQIMAGQIGSLTTRMGTAEGNITVAQQTATSASQAISAIDTTVTAEYGTWEAMATQTAAAVATANTVQAQQRLGVVAGAQGASLELLAWDGAAGSGNAVVLSTDMLLIQDGTGNLVIDGGTWRSGDGRGIPEGSAFEVVARDPSHPALVVQSAPAPWLLFAPEGYSSTADRIPLFDRIAVKAGDRFSWSFDLACTGGADRNARWEHIWRWFDLDGGQINDFSFETATSNQWETRSGVKTAPHDGELWVELRKTGPNQVGRGAITNLDIRKQVSGVTAITPNSVTADLVNAGSFQAAGLAVFGGTLQSADYSAGSTGWRIQNNGNAEFNNLVARGWLQVGSVSDIEQVFMPNEYIRDSAGWAVAATITLGNMSPTDMWFVHASASYRRLFGETLGAGKDAEWAPGYVGSRMRVRRRVQVDGVWEAWGQLAFFEVGYLQDTTWQPIMFNETIAGDHTNVQYRIETERGVGQFRNPSATNFRRIALVGRRVMR